MKKCFLLFLLLLLGCGGDQGDLPDLFLDSSIDSSSSSKGLSSSSSGEISSSSSGKISSSSSSATLSSSSGFKYGRDVKVNGETYKTVIIGEQTWFQRNLNFGEGIVGVDWATANAACPSGWSLPTTDDWYALMLYADLLSIAPPYEDADVASETAGVYLKIADGWNSGDDGNWWSATQSDEDFAYNWSLYSNDNAIYWYDNPKTSLFNVRCLKN